MPSFHLSNSLAPLVSLGLIVAATSLGCSDDSTTDDETTETGDGDGDPGDGDPGDGDPGDGDPGDGDGDPGDGDGDPGDGDPGDGDGDPFPGEFPETFCPGDPNGNCDDVPDAPLLAGAAVVDIVPSCFESWTDIDQDGEFDPEDDFLDCGCDRLCPMDPGYQAADEGENDGEFQVIWLAGFHNNRPARGVRSDDMGLVPGDGLWARAVVLEQGNTRVALVAIDAVGYFYDEVVAIRELLADQDLDWVMVEATHNHEGPDTVGLWGQSQFEDGFDPDYRAELRMKVVEAVTTAIANLEEVGTVTVGRGDASTAHVGQPDKGIRNVSNDSRDPFIVDEAVDVLNFTNLQGDSIVTLINFATHPEAVSDENTLITADYPHALRRTVESGTMWTNAPNTAGLGGVAIFFSGAVGGLMTPLGIQTTTPDGDTWSSGQFEKADAIGQLVGEIAITAVENGEVIDSPHLEFAAQTFMPEVQNDGFKLLFINDVIVREIMEVGQDLFVTSEMGILELGPVRMLTVPGELFPELAVGGYDGSQMFTNEVDFIDPNNPNPPDLNAAPQGPYIKERMGSPYTWILGLGLDELGYIVPNYDFVLGNPAYLVEAEGDHYEETNSLGPGLTAHVDAEGDKLIEFIEWLD